MINNVPRLLLTSNVDLVLEETILINFGVCNSGKIFHNRDHHVNQVNNVTIKETCKSPLVCFSSPLQQFSISQTICREMCDL